MYHKNVSRHKRIASFAVALTMAGNMLTLIPASAEVRAGTARSYTGDGYTVKYEVHSVWSDHCNVNVTLTNTDADSIKNWALKYDTKGSIENIWNGVVYDSDENSSIIKNAGYNYEVKPGDSVSYGYTVAGTVDFPESISLCTRSVEYGADEYTVTLNVDNDWDTGFTGTINVTATGDKPVEAWTLGFDADFELTSVQNGCIVSSDNNSYTVESSYINAFIQPGETRSFGISGRKDAGAVPSVNDFSLNGYIVDGEYSSEGTHNGDDEKPSDDKPDNGSDEKPDDHDDPVVNDTDIVIYAMGTFNAQQNAVDIEWYSTEDGEYDIMESDDNSEYTKVTSVSGFNTYSYKITESFVKKYIKIRVKAGNRTAESIPFVVKVSSDGYTVEMLDTDNDGLTDLLEEMLGTDKTKPDTDEDGLTDHQEMYITGTDPSKYDSVTEGVADGNADPDNDGLGNLREIELGTNPNDDDTDHDGLNDGDEVNVYGTDPLNSDTDHDGLPDGDEPHIGLDPTNPKTFGTPDAEYVTEQTIPADSEVLEEINTPENPYELSIEYTGTGYAEGNLTAGESSYSAAISSDMQLGTIAELSFGDSCNLNKAVLKYSIKNGYLNNEVGTYAADNEELKCIKRLGVFTFDEETNILIPVVTEYDTVSNTLTAEVDTQGTYLLIDMEKWLDEWDIADTSSALVRIPNIAVASSAVQTNSSARERGRPHDVAFLLQCSTVNEYSLEKDKKLIENLCSQLFYDYSDINIYIVKYYNDYNQTNFVKIHDDSYALHSISEVKAALALCKYDRCLSHVRRSIAMDRIMNTIGNRHMHYDYIFDLMNGYTYAPYRSDTRLLFEKYNTMYSEISFGHYEYDDVQQFYEQFFADYGSLAIYDIGNSDIKLLDAQNKMYEFITGHPFQSVSYISSLNLRKLDLKHPLEVNGTTDSDSDGLTDWEEVLNEGNLITHDGTRITALPTYEKYVNYALRNSERAESIRTFIRKKIGVGRYDIVKNIKVLPLKSDPKKKDTDGDGVDDNDDYTPTITASNLSLYKIVDDFDNFNFFDSFVGEYKRRQEEIADSTYRSIRLSQEEMIELKIKKQFAYLYVIGGQGVFAGSNAAWALSWYLSENGLDRKISTIGMISFLLTGSGKLHYQTELSSVSDFAKNVLKDGDTIVLVSSNPFTSYKKNECLVNAMEDPELIINNVNWAATLGDSSGALVAEVTRHGNTYSMKYRYLIYDYYDWDLGNDWGLFEDIPGLNNLSVTDSEFAMMHYTGIARAYFQYGELKGSFTYSDFLEPYQGIPFIYYDYDQEEAEICLP